MDFNQVELSLKKLGQGFFSDVYAFKHQGQELVLRLSKHKQRFQREADLHHFLSPYGVSIPKTYLTGIKDGCEYALTEHCAGKQPTEAQLFDILPDIVETLFQLHTAPLPLGAQAHNLDISHRPWNQRFWEWLQEKKIFSENNLSHVDFTAQLISAVENLIQFCPTELYWFHGDLNITNLLTEAKALTGLLDWHGADVGDWCYDYACFMMYTDLPSQIFIEQIPAFYRSQGLNTDFFSSRLLCYFLFGGVNLIQFAISLGDETTIARIRKQLLWRWPQLQDSVAQELASKEKHLAHQSKFNNSIYSYRGVKVSFLNVAKSLELLAQGQYSKVYALKYAGQEMVLRLSLYQQGFQREQALYDLLDPQGVPIPRTHLAGIQEGHEYALTERCPGQAPEEAELSALSPELLKVLLNLHTSPLPAHPEAVRLGLYSSSWAQRLQERISWHRQEFMQVWPDDLPDSDFHLSLLDASQSLLQTCPAELFWSHGELKKTNICVQDQRITGLLDWSMAQLGDWVFDYASLMLYAQTLPLDFFCKEVPRAYQERGVRIQNYTSRLLCYFLLIAAGLQQKSLHQKERDIYFSIRKQVLTYWPLLHPYIEQEQAARAENAPGAAGDASACPDSDAGAPL